MSKIIALIMDQPMMKMIALLLAELRAFLVMHSVVHPMTIACVQILMIHGIVFSSAK